MAKVRQLDQIEADVIESRLKYQHLLEYMADKPLLLEELKFVVTTLSDKATALEMLYSQSDNKIDNYHLDNAIKNLQLAKYEGKLSKQKQLVLTELLKQKKDFNL